MPIVTVQIGQLCAGGGHVEVRTLVDGRVVSTEWLNATDLVVKGSAALETSEQAKDRILKETEAQDLNTYKIAVEAKAVQVKDTPPKDAEPIKPEEADALIEKFDAGKQ